MSARTPLLAGNWKMNGAWSEAEALFAALENLRFWSVDVLICPPFTALASAAAHFAGTEISWGAQNVYPKDAGAYTGEISPRMLSELGCAYCIVGHSERRQYFGETDDFIHEKVKALFAHHVTPILCVGETAEERAAGKTETIISREVTAGIADLETEEIGKLVIAYEPIWAIGTGAAATAGDAEEVARLIRGVIEKQYGPTLAALVRVLYGGSVKSGNISDFLKEKNIDGALIGGASLDAAEFAAIIENAERV